MDIEKRSYQAAIRTASTGGRPAIIFTIPYNSEAANLGFRETLQPGCFAQTIKAANSGEADIFALWSHNADKPLGSTTAGNLELRDTKTALEVVVFVDKKISWVQDAWRACISGVVKSCSFGFRLIKDATDESGLRTIIQAELLEVSPVVFPAYPSTNVTARNNKQNTNKRGKKMETKNIYTGANLANILSQLEDVEYLSREYCELGDQWDKVSSVVHPGAPSVMKKETRVSVAGLRNWFDQSSSWDSFTPEPFDSRTARDYGFNEDDSLSSDHEKRSSKRYNKSFDNYCLLGSSGVPSSEFRALQSDDDPAGGYLTAPMQLSKSIIQDLDSALFIRKMATIHQVKHAASLGVPSLDNDPADPIWTAEIATGDEDSTMSFGKREMNPHPLAKRIKVSRKLLSNSLLSPGKIVTDRLSYSFSSVMEYCFLNGHGNNQPLGLFTASADGVPTSRDVSDGNTTTAVTADGLINALYALSPEHQLKSSWIFHPDIVREIRKLKDGDGRYIWSAGLADGRPDTILGRPFFQSSWAPNTLTTGQYVGMIANLSYYWIVDALNLEIQRLVELYAETNQVGFIGRLETDGQPVLASAFSRVTLA